MHSRPIVRLAPGLWKSVGACLLALSLSACGGLAPLVVPGASPGTRDADELRGQIEARLLAAGLDAGSSTASGAVGSGATHSPLPFELAPGRLPAEVERTLDERLRAVGDDAGRVARVIDYVFSVLDLRYALEPTRDAADTLLSAEGNCLSFVNLFVALGRRIGLAPFYVEVESYGRWAQADDLVVSQGHIVAGLWVGGELRTYDFLPYRVRAYRSLRPIDDLRAIAHFYNNRGAEALLDGDLEAAERDLQRAAILDPAFVQGLNNYGVALARRGAVEEAIETYRAGLAVAPDDVPLWSNLAIAYGRLGQVDQAAQALARAASLEAASPFLKVSRAEGALARGQIGEALELLRAALALDTELPEVHLGLTEAYFLKADLRRARHHLERAVRLEDQHPDIARLRSLLDTEPPDRDEHLLGDGEHPLGEEVDGDSGGLEDAGAGV